jgi:hypothetical protein
VFAILVIFVTFPLIKECFAIFLEVAPPNMDANTLISELQRVDYPLPVRIKRIRSWHVTMGENAVNVYAAVGKKSPLSPGPFSAMSAGEKLSSPPLALGAPECPNELLSQTRTTPVSLHSFNGPDTAAAGHLVAAALTSTVHNDIVRRIQYALWRTHRVRREYCNVMIEYENE